MSAFEDLQQELETLQREGRSRRLVPRRVVGSQLVGSDGRGWINFGGNDYLGYAADATTIADAAVGSTASALVCGWSDRHQQLVESLSAFEATEAAVLFPSGYAACSGTVATLAREGDLIFSDALNHASLIDGCRLSRADRLIYPHGDVSFLDDVLSKQRGRYKRVWIVTDSVFSMDGDLAPLVELCDLASRHHAELIVDEAHATGVLGASGSGACEALGVRDRVAIRIGTLSKAIGAQGGFVVGPQVVIDYLINHCRTLIYSTALSPVAVTAASQRIDDIRSDPSRRRRLAERIAQFHRLRSEAPPALGLWPTPIIPLLIGDCGAAVEQSQRLSEAGFFVPAIRPPTVPEGTARLRISLSAAHTPAEVAALVEAIRLPA